MTYSQNYASKVLETIENRMGGRIGSCTVRLCEFTEKWNEDSSAYFVFSDPNECGAPLFISKESGRRLPCGACEIRNMEMVSRAKKFLWVRAKETAGSPETFSVVPGRKFSHLVAMYGCEVKRVMGEALKEFERERKAFEEERIKREREADRIREAKRKDREVARV